MLGMCGNPHLALGDIPLGKLIEALGEQAPCSLLDLLWHVAHSFEPVRDDALARRQWFDRARVLAELSQTTKRRAHGLSVRRLGRGWEMIGKESCPAFLEARAVPFVQEVAEGSACTASLRPRQDSRRLRALIALLGAR